MSDNPGVHISEIEGSGLSTVTIETPNGEQTGIDCNTFIVIGGMIDYTHNSGKDPYPILNCTTLIGVPHPFVAYQLLLFAMKETIMPWWKAHVAKMLRAMGQMLPEKKQEES